MKGIEAKSQNRITLFGALDDLWLNKDTDEIVVLDYKATSNKNDPDYVNSSQEYHKSYKRQLDFYAYLLKLNNYKIFKTPVPKDDPLEWTDSKSYKERLKSARKKQVLIVE